MRGGDCSGNTKVASKLVVSKMHVEYSLGKVGKIIEQMRMETKTQIRVLSRDRTLPRCVSMSEEIVQVFLTALLLISSLYSLEFDWIKTNFL